MKCSLKKNSRMSGTLIFQGSSQAANSLSASFNTSPKGANLRAPFLVQFFDFWDIFWATIYEKSLTECSVRDFCGEDEIRTRGTE